MYIILLGAPGAGKGTQAVMLAEKMHLVQVASGDLFRKALAEQTGLGKKAKIKGAEVYRSEDGGESFNKVSRSTVQLEQLLGTYGWVFGQIRVDPGDENTVYIMGVPLAKSTDGGKNFKILDYPGLHADHHAMWIDPEDSGFIVNGNDGGVNISYDGGESKDFFLFQQIFHPG